MPNEIIDEAMEFIRPPPSPKPKPGEPTAATKRDLSKLRSKTRLTKSIAGAAALFENKCEGSDSYENNCAHYLSNAFLRAGYTELAPPSDCINARCGTTAKRPIRARDMWCWFKAMATESETAPPKNSGLWAVFQLKESDYWGGHVLIIDTDSNKYYGTGNYPHWDQYFYKW